MTSRTLTEVFILMRNNAMQSRNIYSEQNMSDSQSLIRRKSRDPEIGLELRGKVRSPPEWLDKLEESQYNVTKIRSKLDELRALHTIVLLRPGFEDECPEEGNIEILAVEITRLINSVHKYAQRIEGSRSEGSKMEQSLTSNVVLALCTLLQEISMEFHAEQNKYLNHLQSRNKRHQSFFETPDFSKTNADSITDSYFTELDELPTAEDTIDQAFGIPVNSRLSQKQLMLFEEENTKMVEQREKEVVNIVQSISDLNVIFKDLAHMIRHQGTVLDRIDYNIEQTQVQVSEGYRQLIKADAYHRRHTKIYCIMILASITITMLILLIIMKF